MQAPDVVNDWRGIVVKVGMESPYKRAFVAFVLVAGVMYVGGLPRAAFDEEGNIKRFAPINVGPEDARGKHFLVAPSVAAACCGLLI